MNYEELTGQESGIWIYKKPLTTPRAIICNWSSDYCDGCMPLVFENGLVWLPIDEDTNWELVADGATLDCWMDDCEVIYDENGDAFNTDWSLTKGKFYEGGDYVIIAPEGWN